MLPPAPILGAALGVLRLPGTSDTTVHVRGDTTDADVTALAKADLPQVPQFDANGTVRDTAVYSIIAGEWPTVQANLNWLLEKSREG